MKIKLLLFSLSLFLTVPIFIYPQVTSGKKESEKKQEEKVVLKPPAYDSTQTLEEQYKLENQYQFIGLQLFLPPVINPEAGPVVFSKKGSGFEKGNRTYTIIDILKGDFKAELTQKKVINLCGYRYKDFNSPLWKEMIIHVIFVLQENNKNDSANNAPLYWVVCESKQVPYSNSYFNSFVAVPYFEKQKQLYQNQNIIKLNDKSKWLCKEVALVKGKNNSSQDSITDVFCLLKNEKGEQIQLSPPSVTDKMGKSFITEKEYIWLDHANRNEKEQLIKEENDKCEKHKAICISKFGQHNGELIAQNKIEIGMTTEMCQFSWGTPWDISKTTTSSVTKEVWFYNWKYNLHFEKGILVKIKH
jgi:hypothetical protein